MTRKRQLCKNCRYLRKQDGDVLHGIKPKPAICANWKNRYKSSDPVHGVVLCTDANSNLNCKHYSSRDEEPEIKQTILQRLFKSSLGGVK